MKVYRIILIIVGLAFFDRSLSQDIPEQLSLDEAISIALEKNFDIKLARNSSQISINNAVRSNAGFLPQVGGRDELVPRLIAIHPGQPVFRKNRKHLERPR